jgi:glycosyltransferase involved in cell wall biosynthesis
VNVVITNDAMDIAGGENHALYVAQGLREEGHNIILCPQENSMLFHESVKQGFETIAVPYCRGGRQFFRAINIMVKKLKNKKTDVIHSNSNSDRTISAITAKKLNCSNITTVHSCQSIRNNIVHWYRNKYLIHHFIADGYSSKKILTENDKIPENKVTVIHTCIPDSIAQFSDEKRKSTRNKLNISSDDIVIGIIARLVDFKGINILIDSLKIIKEKENINNVKILIVGDGILRDELEQQTERFNLKNKIIFTGFRNDLDNCLSAMDIYTQPSLSMNAELFPISALLAKSAGLPLIVSDSGDLKYLVNDNSDGFVIDPGDADILADKLMNIIKNKELRKEMGKNSLENYRQNYTLKIMIQKILCVYNKV